MEVHERYVEQNPELGHTSIVEETRHVPSAAEHSEAKAEKSNNWIWYVAGIFEALLGLRFIFKLLGASDTGFASFLYSLTNPLVAPFNGVFANPAASGSVFDSAALLAILIISLVAWGIVGLVDLAMRPSHTPHSSARL